MARDAQKDAVAQLKHSVGQEPDRSDGGTAADEPGLKLWDVWSKDVEEGKKSVAELKSKYDAVKKGSDKKVLARKVAHGPLNMEWACSW